MYLQHLASGCIAFLSAVVSAPSCGDADALTGPRVEALGGASFNEQGGPRVVPPNPGIAVTEEAVGDSVVRYLVRITTTDDGRGKVQNYFKRVRLLVAGDTVYHAISSDTAFVVDVPRPLLAADTTLFETAGIRRGLTSDTVRVKRPIQPRADVPPPSPDVVVDTVAVDTTVADSGVIVSPPPSNVVGVAELPRVYVSTAYPATTRTYRITGGLQAALDTARRGDRILLAPGTYTGNYVLPAKAGTAVIVLQCDRTLPSEGTRVQPHTGGCVIQTTTSVSALRSADDGLASHYRLVGLTLTSTAAMTYAVTAFGNGGATTYDELPTGIILDRVVVSMNPLGETQRCVALNTRASAVIDSYLKDCKHNGSDSQGIISWYGAGPFAIVNNRIEGAGENIMLGGADPRIPGLVPSDIEVRRNHIVKPAEWCDTLVPSIKNLFETKNARRLLVEDNILENNCADSQTGFAVVLKSANQSGGCDWCVTEDVTFRWNRIINSPGGFNLAAFQAEQGGTAIPMRRVVIVHLEMVGVGFPLGTRPGADYRMFQMLGGLTSMHVSHVTSLGTAGVTPPVANQVIMFDGAAGSDLRFTDNLFAKTTYGIFGSGKGEGNNAIAYYAPGSTITGNILVGANCGIYPAGNTCPTTVPLSGGVDRAELDRRLAGVK